MRDGKIRRAMREFRRERIYAERGRRGRRNMRKGLHFNGFCATVDIVMHVDISGVCVRVYETDAFYGCAFKYFPFYWSPRVLLTNGPLMRGRKVCPIATGL